MCVCVSLLPMMSGLWLVGGVTRVAPRGHAIRALDVVDVVEVVGVVGVERDGEGWRGMERDGEGGGGERSGRLGDRGRNNSGNGLHGGLQFGALEREQEFHPRQLGLEWKLVDDMKGGWGGCGGYSSSSQPESSSSSSDSLAWAFLRAGMEFPASSIDLKEVRREALMWSVAPTS